MLVFLTRIGLFFRIIMMDKRVDGHTVWGKRWLGSLINADLSAQVERAMKMIGKWEVKDLGILKNVIKARVSENAKKSYYLQFFMQRWEEESVDILVGEIMKNPLLSANIMRGEMSDKNSFDAITLCLNKAGLSLFPTSKKELKIYCSCPSWSMPCLHVALVLYRLVFEIDKNPFILFSLHGVDLREELRQRSGQTEETAVDIEPLSNLLKVATKESTASSALCGPQGLAPFVECEEQLGKIEDMGFIYSVVLPNSPGFCPTHNFRIVVEEEMHYLSMRARKMLTDPEHAHELLRMQKPRMDISQPCKYTVSQDIECDTSWNFKLLIRLVQLSDGEIQASNPYMKAMRESVIAALHLIANKAVIPQIGERSDGEWSILWRPAMMDARITAAIQALDKCLPPDLLTTRRKHQLLENQAEMLITLILNNIINVTSSQNSSPKQYNILFKGEAISSNKAGLAEQIKLWLDHITIGSHHISPIIVVNDSGADDDHFSDFSIDIAIEIEGETNPMSAILDDARYEEVRNSVILEVSMLMPYIKKLDKYIVAGAKKPIVYLNDEFLEFLTQMMPMMQQIGIRIMLPNSMRDLVKPNIRRTVNIQAGGVGHLSLAEMLDIKWEVSLDDETLSPQAFAKIARTPYRLYRYNNRYFYLDEDEIVRLKEALRGEAHLTSAELLQTALSESYLGEPVHLTDEVRKAISQLSKEPELAVPRGLKGKLRPYQKRGYEWMYRNSQLGFGSIIADDMGLGKTIQVIALLLKLKQDAKKEKKDSRPRFLVVVPTTLITNWQAELDRFAPSLIHTVYHGSGRDLGKFKGDVLLTTYGVVRSDADILQEEEWHTVVIDEAQNIKNAHTAQSRIIRRLKAHNHIAMSGTPIENRMAEFWSIMDFANHGYLGSAEKFRTVYSNPIEQFGDKECAERFRRITAPFLLRRLKSDKSIINDLPDKIEENSYVTLTDEQQELYSRAASEALAIIEKTDKETSQSLFKRQGLILQMILTLKQICNHPNLFTGKDKSQHKEPTAAQSGKSAMLTEMVEGIVANGQKALIFTQFREMGDLLVKFINDAIGEEPLFLHGGCSTKERKQMVDEFQSNPSRHIFILSIKAGGTGLNLTAASHVIHYDLWWNPAVESQATDRAYRIGQHQNVIVHRFITKESFEEQIDRMLQEKKNLADMTVATGESWIAKLSDEELEEIFK